MRSPRVGIAVLLFVTLAVVAAPGALANGGAVKVPLKYLPSVSNWGPTAATGIGSVDVSDGEVIVTASGLPQLAAERYEGWLITGSDLVSVGRFNADASSAIQFRVVLERLPARKYDLFLITVEPEPDNDPKPSAQRTIGGYFNPMMGTPTGSPSGTGNPTPGGQTGSTPGSLPGTTPANTPIVSMTPPYTAPIRLPNTGDGPTSDDFPGVAILGVTTALAALSGVLAARRPLRSALGIALRARMERRRRS